MARRHQRLMGWLLRNGAYIQLFLRLQPVIRIGTQSSLFFDPNWPLEKGRKAHYFQTLTRHSKRHAKLIRR
ncbi:MAG: hypothetical protein EZS28_002027 [Streblomastix strix]|uniref:Uncharacterized protein n=1 Tax=Streblomastix strix TaxID=222440 RepID=A0A5J4X5D2_9EUKA|nr:MAG: hypothetical protein EZS28_002027 [Streblomastix strix]